MPELRLNLITGEWVVIAKEKNKSPEDFIGHRERKHLPEHLDTCPFCTGNEAKTPDERYRVQDEKGWRIRVVPNKFSVLSKDGDRDKSYKGIKKSVNGVGIHEVIVETPFHNHTTGTMPVEQLQEVIRVYRERFVEIYKDPRVEHVIIFKNNGQASGTGLEHSLSQIAGIPITPRQVRSRIEHAMKFFDDNGECLMCATIRDELSDHARVVMDTEHFIAFVPYAALSPFHLWIFPKRHSGAFSDIRSEEIWDLALTLRTVMSRLYHGLEHPDYNYVIRSGRPTQVANEYMHWYLSIVPRVSTSSGFEIGSGMYINPLAPEASAEFLRKLKLPG